jgi:hypothetical protein
MMPNRSGKRGQGPRDFSQIAYEVFQKAIGEIPKEEPADPTKNLKAVTQYGHLSGPRIRTFRQIERMNSE